MVQEIIDQLQPYIRATRLAWSVLGLAEMVSKDDGRSFPVVYTGQDNAQEVVARDIQTGITFWMRNGDATQEQLDAVRENDPVVRYSIPLRLYCLSGRRVYGRDVPASPEMLAQKMRAAIVRATIPQLRQTIGVSRAFTELVSVNTNTDEVIESAFTGIDLRRLDMVAVSIDINAVLIAREACLIEYACRQSVLEPVPGGAILFNNETAAGEVALINPGGDFLIPNQY